MGLKKAINSGTVILMLMGTLFASRVDASEPADNSEGNNEDIVEKAEEAGGFDAKHMILGHIQDSHEIHFITLNEGTEDETHITLPLPVIIYSSTGFDFFLASKFHHGHDDYTSSSTGNTYRLEEGKIVETSGVSMVDLSITKNVLGIFVTLFLMIWLFTSAAKGYKKRPGKAPKGIQSVMEPMIIFIRDEVAKPSIGSKHERFVPFLLTLFFFIWISNMLGLIPFLGGLNVTGSLGVTVILASLTFLVTMFSSKKAYWSHLIAPPGVPFWLLPIMIPIELLGVFTKPFVLMVRLTANITAGHIIILSFVSLIFIFTASAGTGVGVGVSIGSTLFMIFMNFIELLVAFIQAYVFVLLSAIYIGEAAEEAH